MPDLLFPSPPSITHRNGGFFENYLQFIYNNTVLRRQTVFHVQLPIDRAPKQPIEPDVSASIVFGFTFELVEPLLDYRDQF